MKYCKNGSEPSCIMLDNILFTLTGHFFQMETGRCFFQVDNGLFLSEYVSLLMSR